MSDYICKLSEVLYSTIGSLGETVLAFLICRAQNANLFWSACIPCRGISLVPSVRLPSLLSLYFVSRSGIWRWLPDSFGVKNISVHCLESDYHLHLLISFEATANQSTGDVFQISREVLDLKFQHRGSWILNAGTRLVFFLVFSDLLVTFHMNAALTFTLHMNP